MASTDKHYRPNKGVTNGMVIRTPDPTADEIARVCAEIRKSWPDDRYIQTGPVEIRVCRDVRREVGIVE